MTSHQEISDNKINQLAECLIAIDSTQLTKDQIKSRCVKWVNEANTQNISLSRLLSLMKEKYPKKCQILENNLHRAMVSAIDNDRNKINQHTSNLYEYLRANPNALDNVREYWHMVNLDCTSLIFAETSPPITVLLHALFYDFLESSNLSRAVAENILNDFNGDAGEFFMWAKSIDINFHKSVFIALNTKININIRNKIPPSHESTMAIKAIFGKDARPKNCSIETPGRFFRHLFIAQEYYQVTIEHVDIAFEYLRLIDEQPMMPKIPDMQPAIDAKNAFPILCRRLPAAQRLMECVKELHPEAENHYTNLLLMVLPQVENTESQASPVMLLKRIGHNLVNNNELDFGTRLLCALEIMKASDKDLIEAFRDDAGVSATVYKLRPIRELLPHMNSHQRRMALTDEFSL